AVRQMRILIVEDEARIRAFLARAFEAEGFGVDVVEDGQRGLERALSGDYDLLILDLLLPRLSGLEALRELHRQRAELPVLILSARSDLPTKLRGFELGAVDYVAKPFSLDELLARARVQLRHARVTDEGTVLRRYQVELLWLGFAVLNYAAMIAWPSWETIPFHFVWISLTLLYGFRVWPTRATLIVLAGVMLATAASISLDAFEGIQLWGEL